MAEEEMWNYVGECIWGAQSHSGKKRERRERDRRLQPPFTCIRNKFIISSSEISGITDLENSNNRGLIYDVKIVTRETWPSF